jgi:hypothetical protein
MTCTVLAEVVAAALLLDHRFVDLAGGEVVALAHPGAREALVVAEVEVGLRTVFGDEDLAVLERAHGARVDVDVRVQLEVRDLDAAGLEDGPEGGGGDALAQGGHDTAGNEDVFGHMHPSRVSTPRAGAGQSREADIERGSRLPPRLQDRSVCTILQARRQPRMDERLAGPIRRAAAAAFAPSGAPTGPATPPRFCKSGGRRERGG